MILFQTRLFEQNKQRLYHYPINHERLIIGKFCSIAWSKISVQLCQSYPKNHYPLTHFPLFYEDWELDKANVASAWDNKGDIVIGNDVWIGYEAVIMAGVHIGDGLLLVQGPGCDERCSPYTIVGGVPAKEIRKRFSPDIIEQMQALKWWDWSVDKIQEFCLI